MKVRTVKNVPIIHRWLAGLFFVVGSILFAIMTPIPLIQMAMAHNWSAVPCTVISSQMNYSHGRRHGGSCRIDITYSYKWDGQEYQSNRHHFGEYKTWPAAWKNREIEKYSAGSVAECFVNPRHPDKAVLHRGPTWDLAFGLFGLVFMSFSILLFLAKPHEMTHSL